jgi:hypothetical protein
MVYTIELVVCTTEEKEPYISAEIGAIFETQARVFNPQSHVQKHMS